MKPQVCLRCGLPHDTPCTHVPADYQQAVEAARQLLGYPDDPFVRTPFRTHMNLPLRTESQLRQMARGQVAEARASGGR